MADEPENQDQVEVKYGAIAPGSANDVHHFYIEDHGDPRCGNVTTILGVSGRGVEKVR